MVKKIVSLRSYRRLPIQLRSTVYIGTDTPNSSIFVGIPPCRSVTRREMPRGIGDPARLGRVDLTSFAGNTVRRARPTRAGLDVGRVTSQEVFRGISATCRLVEEDCFFKVIVDEKRRDVVLRTMKTPPATSRVRGVPFRGDPPNSTPYTCG